MTGRPAPAIVILGNGSLATARRIQQRYPDAVIHGLAGRVDGADHDYQEFGATLRELYQQDTPIIALCAAGIVIRTLAPLLLEKGAEPPVLAVAEDGSAVVPLLGGLGGVNVLAREIAAALDVAAAITTSGELRFGTCLLNPPSGYALGDLELGKRFVSDLLAGEAVRIEGPAPWLAEAQLPEDRQARLAIHVGHAERQPNANELLIYPRNVLVAVTARPDLASIVRSALHEANIALPALACVLASESDMANPVLREAALELGVPLRFSARSGTVLEQVRDTLPSLLTSIEVNDSMAIAVAAEPLDPGLIGRPRGRLAVIGLGPGAAELMVPAVKAELARANDVLGYETYVRMAGPFRADQVMHCTDNREEMQRARHAFELAASGRSVVVVSSGDPGVFAMAAAVLEALHESADTAWHNVELEMLPGVSASLATAAQAGALHFFAVVGAVHDLIGTERPSHAHIGFVAKNVIGPRQFGFHRRHHQLGRTRAQADHCQTATRTADMLGVQWLVGDGDGNPIANGQRRQQLRHGVLGQHADALCRRGKTQGHAQFKGRFAQGRTGHVAVSGQQAGHRLRGDSGLVQRLANLRRQVFIPPAAARHQHTTRVDQQFIGRRFSLGGAHMNAQARVLILRQPSLGQPRRGPFDAHAFTAQQVGNKTFAQLQVRQGIAAGRVQQAGAKPQFATGGDGRHHAQSGGDFPRQHIDPAQTTEQRHHGAAVFGDGQHRWFGAFFQ